MWAPDDRPDSEKIAELERQKRRVLGEKAVARSRRLLNGTKDLLKLAKERLSKPRRGPKTYRPVQKHP